MPSFSKILLELDVKKRMAVRSDFVQHLPETKGGETVNFPVVDVSTGTTWQFGYYVRREGHPKPVFHGGWHEYRRHKGLNVGDKITFWAEGGSYRIQAQRKIKLMGHEVWTSDF